MIVAGIDFDTHGVDLVLLDEFSDNAIHRRFPLPGADAFTRARMVPSRIASWPWNDVLAIGIEDPRGASRTVDAPIYRVQGAILACIPEDHFVHPWKPQSWRKALVLPHIGKQPAMDFARRFWLNRQGIAISQDAADAFCIAIATRAAIVREIEVA